MRTAVLVLVLIYRGGPVRSSVLSPRTIALRTGTGPDPATLDETADAVDDETADEVDDAVVDTPEDAVVDENVGDAE